MPCFKILTNLPKSGIPTDFFDKLILVLAKALRKPEENFVCVVVTDCHVSLGGDVTTPGAIASLESIGHINARDNKAVTTEVSEVVKKELGINPERLFISFYDLKAENIGKGGIIISELPAYQTPVNQPI